MEQVTGKGKQISYRPRPEVREFLEQKAGETYRSVQGMMDFFMDKVMELEKKGEINIR